MSYLGLLAEIPDKETRDGLMEFANYFRMMLGYAISAAPALIFWIAVIILVTVRLRHDGGRAKRFLIVGAGLGIIGSLVRIPAAAVSPWLFQQGYSLAQINSATLAYGIIPDIIGMAGIISLTYAFWVKFKAIT